jgi:hypothetical protein
MRWEVGGGWWEPKAREDSVAVLLCMQVLMAVFWHMYVGIWPLYPHTWLSQVAVIASHCQHSTAQHALPSSLAGCTCQFHASARSSTP